MSEQLSLGFGVTKNADSWFETGGKDSRGGRLPSYFPWTEEQVEKLRKLTDDGLSCSQIAAQLGTSRNSVIGKQHRVGIRSKRPSTQSVARAKPRKSKLYPERIFKPYTKSTRKPPMDFDNYQSPTMEVVPLKLSLLELKADQCRYPYGEPSNKDFFFCGLPAIEGRSYCLCHYQLTHTKGGWERPDRRFATRKAFFPTKATLQTISNPIDRDERGEAA